MHIFTDNMNILWLYTTFNYSWIHQQYSSVDNKYLMLTGIKHLHSLRLFEDKIFMWWIKSVLKTNNHNTLWRYNSRYTFAEAILNFNLQTFDDHHGNFGWPVVINILDFTKHNCMSFVVTFSETIWKISR